MKQAILNLKCPGYSTHHWSENLTQRTTQKSFLKYHFNLVHLWYNCKVKNLSLNQLSSLFPHSLITTTWTAPPMRISHRLDIGPCSITAAWNPPKSLYLAFPGRWLYTAFCCRQQLTWDAWVTLQRLSDAPSTLCSLAGSRDRGERRIFCSSSPASCVCSRFPSAAGPLS